MTKMLNRLREETAELHRELEKDNLANKIMDQSIDLEEYKNLLFQNFLAYENAEAEITKFISGYSSDKSMRLKKDLRGIGVENFACSLDFSCTSEAEAIGAAYVLEGSAMGGMLIGKELKKCSFFDEIPEQLFFNGKRDGIKGWNEYLKFLRSRDFSDAEIDSAASKAKETFLLFGEAFKLDLSSC